MDIKSLFREKIESSIAQMSAEERAAEAWRLHANKIANEASTMVLNAANQLSREIAPYKSGIYFKRRYDKINNDIIIYPKYYQPVEGRERNMFIDLSRIDIGCPNRLLSVDRFLDSKCQSRLSSAW